MKFQWNLILALLFALIIAIFAVVNVEDVSVNYIFGTSQWPLILVILGSALMGGLIVGSVGLVRIFILQRKIKQLQRENQSLTSDLENMNDKSDTDILEGPKDSSTMTMEENSNNIEEDQDKKE